MNEAAPKQPEALSDEPVTTEMLHVQHEKIQALHATLNERFSKNSGANLTGELLEQADVMAKKLGEEVEKFNDMTQKLALEKSSMPSTPDASYPSPYTIPANQMTQSPAANDQRPPNALAS